MRIKINQDLHQLSAVRGIGSYQQMLKEALERYGKKYHLEINNFNSDVELLLDFNPFKKLAISSKCHQVAVVHDLIPLKYPEHFPVGLKGKFVWWQNKRLLSKLAGVITDSKAVKKELLAELSISPEKIKVVYPAAKAIYEQAGKAKIPRFANSLPKQFVLYTGDVTWNKNLPNLARAIKLFNQPLVLAGAALVKQDKNDHPWLQSYHEFFKEVKNDKRFIFLGYVSDNELLWLYQQAKILALPSWDEGFGLTWLEASWQNTPCVVAKTAVSQEIMGDAVAYCAANKIETIKEALDKAWHLAGFKTKPILQAKHYCQANYVASLQAALYNLV